MLDSRAPRSAACLRLDLEQRADEELTLQEIGLTTLCAMAGSNPVRLSL